MYALPHISARQKVALSTGFFALFFASQSINALASPFFNMTLGLDPFLLSLALALPLICSAVISKKVGEWSDSWQIKNASRPSIILWSGIFSGGAFCGIWFLPTSWSPNLLLFGLFSVNLLFCIAVTFLIINMKCMAIEISGDAQQRIALMSFTALFERIGAIFYFWLFPLAQLSFFSNVFSGIQVVGTVVGLGLIALLSTISAKLFVVEKNTKTNENDVAIKFNQKLLSPDVKQALTILLWLIVIKLGFISALSALDFYLLVYFVQAGDVAAGANWKGILSSCFAVFSLVLLPLITYIALRYGKIATLIGIYFISALGSLAKWFIYVPGNQAAVVIDALLGASSFVAIAAILPTMLADLSAKTKQQSGYGYQGYFVAAQNKFVNFSIVGAMLGTGVLLNIIGFDARLGELQSEQSLFWMRICLAGGTFCLNGVSLLILLKYPFTDKQQIMR